ncbi:MAG TPA: AMP-binding protein [Prolixibacteraceae bacterium]|nr:AMP-binding protein [Prolixibacteraceae bacterium]
MNEAIKLTLPDRFSQIVQKFGERNALSFVGEKPLTYSMLSQNVNALIRLLEELGIQAGDKIAILGANSPNWGIAYFAITFMGAVAVPLLPDFLPSEIENIIIHSETKAIFLSEKLAVKLDSIQLNSLTQRIRIEDFAVTKTPGQIPVYNPDQTFLNRYEVQEDDVAAIIYTSGTTGKSKGVMLSHKNICITTEQSLSVRPVNENDRYLSILPLSHTYENSLGFVMPMLKGSSVYYLGKQPTPSILLPALLEVKPTMMFTVPLIIEKIYRNKILPAFTAKWPIRQLYKVPYIRKKLNRLAGKKLIETFGGKIEFFGIGGAKLDRNVEKFLIEARFPYSIGYGLTETAPLLAGMKTYSFRLQSTGPAIAGVELKINNPGRKTGEGEIWARGANVMKGYYKEPELTSEVITPDGWFKTGDLGKLDKDGFLFIRGRLKNIIIGSSGENIYPEEIESVINDFPDVLESLVIQKKGKIVAMVHLNMEELQSKYSELIEKGSTPAEQKMNELLKELQTYVNQKVNKFSQIQMLLIQPEPFQKTATQKIKRFLYS